MYRSISYIYEIILLFSECYDPRAANYRCGMGGKNRENGRYSRALWRSVDCVVSRDQFACQDLANLFFLRYIRCYIRHKDPPRSIQATDIEPLVR